MSSLRILYLCGDQGIPAFGRKGASTHMREMIAAFRDLGHEVALAATDLSGDRRPEEDFPVYELPSPKSRKLGIDGRYYIANYQSHRLLRTIAAEFKPTVIYERSALYFDAGGKLAQHLELPRILEVNCFLSEEQKTRLHFPGMARRKEMALIRNASAVAAISDYMVKDIVKETGRSLESTRAFPMAVDPKRFPARERNDVLRKDLGWGDDVTVLGYVGSMNSYHRPVWFLDLAEKLMREGNDKVRFLLVGGSDSKVEKNRGRMMKWIDAGRVHFTGSVPQESMGDWLSAMDAVVIPGASPQSTPTKIFETASLGRPILMPGTEPISSIAGGQAPFLFEPENFNAFEGIVRRYLKDPTAINEASQCFQEKVRQEHTWEAHARALTAWYAAGV